jgi:hypothetical protein
MHQCRHQVGGFRTGVATSPEAQENQKQAHAIPDKAMNIRQVMVTTILAYGEEVWTTPVSDDAIAW